MQQDSLRCLLVSQNVLRDAAGGEATVFSTAVVTTIVPVCQAVGDAVILVQWEATFSTRIVLPNAKGQEAKLKVGLVITVFNASVSAIIHIRVCRQATLELMPSWFALVRMGRFQHTIPASAQEFQRSSHGESR